MTTYAPTNIRQFASTHETAVEIALAIFETAREGDEERVWEEPTDEEIYEVMTKAWAMAAPDTEVLDWGVTRFVRGQTEWRP